MQKSYIIDTSSFITHTKDVFTPDKFLSLTKTSQQQTTDKPNA